MQGSWHVGRWAGIDVKIHWTFLLVPVWIYFSTIAAGSGTVAAIMAVLFVLAIFGCVLLHEYGHALTARRFGIPTRDITLLPIGGVASLQRMPRSPWQELAIAVAGPAVNVFIAALIFLGLTALPIAGPLAGEAVSFLGRLAWVNVALVVFNMIPAFPMDGGRVLRAALALALPYATATKVAAGVGQAAAAVLALLGIISGNLILVLIAGFVFVAARAEAALAGRRGAEILPRAGGDGFVGTMQPDRKPLSIPPLPVVSAQWNANSALGWLSGDTIDEFLVASHGAIIGVARKADLRDAVLAGKGAWAVEQLLALRFIPVRGLGSV